MSTPARVSFGVFALTLVLVGWLHLSTLLMAVLFSYFALSKLHGATRRWTAHKWPAVVLFVVAIVVVGYLAVHFIQAALVALPNIAETSIPSVIAYARSHNIEVPFTDYASLKDVVVDSVKAQAQHLGSAATYARTATTQVVIFIIGVVVAITLFFNNAIDLDRGRHALAGNLYSACCDEIGVRFGTFYESFRIVIGAQVTISSINTVLTAVFLLVVGLKYAAVLVGVTFLCGLLPIVGNLISNTIIVCVAFLSSPGLALAALVFLVLVHKFEYFLNSKIIGNRIHNPVWLTLLGLVVGEHLMGVAGMILAPVVLNYIKMETSKIPGAE